VDVGLTWQVRLRPLTGQHHPGRQQQQHLLQDQDEHRQQHLHRVQQQHGGLLPAFESASRS
jgi:hypothetical protein